MMHDRKERHAASAASCPVVAFGPGRSCTILVLIALVAVPLLVAGCAGADDTSTGDRQQPSPAATSSPHAEAGSDGQDGGGDGADTDGGQPGRADPSATVSALVDEVGQLRGLEPQSPVDVEVVDRQQMGEIAGEIAARHVDEQVIGSDVLAALRFVPEDTDLVELSKEAAAAGAGGMYDEQADTLYVVADEGGLGPFERGIAAHEAVHALQDQHFDLARRLPTESNPDAATAFRYVVEGDAQATQQQWVGSELPPQQRQQYLSEATRQSQQRQQDIAELPQAVVMDLQVPYVVGAEFVQTVRNQHGEGAVDAALADLPDTVVEVIDPQLYLDGFEPREVTGLASPGPEWTESLAEPFSAHMVALTHSPVQAMQGELPVASQWRGGRLRAWRTDGDLAVGVTTTFAGGGASAYCDRVQSWYRQQAQAEPVGEHAFESARDVMAVACDDSDVRFAIAPAVDGARAVIDG